LHDPAPLFKCVEIVHDELISKNNNMAGRLVNAFVERIALGTELAYELSTAWKAEAITMLCFCAASRTSVFGTPSPDLLITELSTNPAQATIYIAVFAKRPNLRRTGGAMVIASRIGDLECSSLSMTMCSNRMESVIIGVTPLRIPIITTVRGSRVVEGESHEYSFSGCRG